MNHAAQANLHLLATGRLAIGPPAAPPAKPAVQPAYDLSNALAFAKFLPGLSSLSVAMAGITKMSLPTFLLLNGIGALLFVSVPVVLRRIFQNEITGLLSTLARVGASGVLIILAALGCYFAGENFAD